MNEKEYKIKVTTSRGKQVFWQKNGEPTLLPEGIVDNWIQKFNTDIWRISAAGEMAGAEQAGPEFEKIVKLEKEEV